MKFFKALFCIALTACAGESTLLPEAVTNNAAAYHAPSQTVYSFTGLGEGKAWTDVHAKGYACTLSAKTCETLAPLPDGIGRLAATAQTIGDEIYIFGGYSVAEDGHEISTPAVWAYGVSAQTYSRKTDMHVPVDDTVSLTYQGRYIYLVSGWHKDDNVVNVQMYDVQTDAWAPASDWPGAPVFGHAGGIVGSVMTICDGVQIIPPKTPEARRSFETISACWRGDIDADDPKKITWRKLPQLPGKGLYRMAATGWAEQNIIMFAGGTDNAYNYNGIGYNKVPSQPSKHVWGYDIAADDYVLFKDKPTATMDHRALIHLGGGEFMTLGGMGKDQKVLRSVGKFKARRAPN